MRVVIDTNVLVAAFRSRTGVSNTLLAAAARRKLAMLASVPLFLEYEEVLKRPEQRLASGLSLEQIDEVLEDLASIVEPIDIQFVWRPQLKDPGDELVLEAAINGRTDRLVTFNVRDFGAAARFGVVVATPRECMQELRR